MSRPTSDSSDRPNNGRRSFIWKAGAAVSAVLATAVPAVSMPNISKGNNGLKSEVDRLAGELGRLEDEHKIRGLHRTFERFLDNGHYENIVELFSADGEATFNGGTFKGKEKGVRRLFCQYFRSGGSGRKVTPASGFEFDTERLQEKIEIFEDGKTAIAQFSYSMLVGTPIISDSVLIKMARLQGAGIMKWWEGGVCEMSCVKNAGGDSWKIKNIDFRTMARAHYNPRRLYEQAIEIPLFSKVYPDDPSGPDKLSGSALRSGKA